MKTYMQVTANLEAPLVIAARRRDPIPQCLDFIPGSVLRGGIISSYVRQNGHDEIFLRLADIQRNVFPFLYPGLEALPYPLSTFECKIHGRDHGIIDTLIASYRACRENATANDWDNFEKLHTCQECKKPRVPCKGFRHNSKEDVSLIKTWRMHVGIDRRTQTAAPKILFGTQSIEIANYKADDTKTSESACFRGYGWFETEDLDVLKGIINQPIYLGKYRSRGYGKVQIKITPAKFQEDRTKKIEEGCRSLKKLLPELKGISFTLDVVSPIISIDPFLRFENDPYSWFDKDMSVNIFHRMITLTGVSGWDYGIGMPKDEALAVGTGSVILAEANMPLKDAVNRLVEIEKNGIGERKNEGFGRVIVNDPFRTDQLR